MSEIETLHQRFCDYSLILKGNTPRTIRWFKETFRYFLRFSNIEKPEQIDTPIIESWIFEGKLKTNWSARTIKNRLQALRSFINWLVKDGYLPNNPIAKIPYPKIPKNLPKHLIKEDALKLLDWAKHFRYDYTFERTRGTAIIATFIFTGIRLQELKNLKMQDVNLTNRTLFVKSGKGEKDRIIPMNSHRSKNKKD